MLARRDRIIPIRLQIRSWQAHLRPQCCRPLPQPVTRLGHLCNHVQHHHAILETLDLVALPPLVPNCQLRKTMVGCRRLYCCLLSRSYIRIMVPMPTYGVSLVS
jgi:hypothetical protein